MISEQICLIKELNKILGEEYGDTNERTHMGREDDSPAFPIGGQSPPDRTS